MWINFIITRIPNFSRTFLQFKNLDFKHCSFASPQKYLTLKPPHHVSMYVTNVLLKPDPRLQRDWGFLIRQRLCQLLHAGNLDGAAYFSAHGFHPHLWPAHDYAAAHHGPL